MKYRRHRGQFIHATKGRWTNEMGPGPMIQIQPSVGFTRLTQLHPSNPGQLCFDFSLDVITREDTRHWNLRSILPRRKQRAVGKDGTVGYGGTATPTGRRGMV